MLKTVPDMTRMAFELNQHGGLIAISKLLRLRRSRHIFLYTRIGNAVLLGKSIYRRTLRTCSISKRKCNNEDFYTHKYLMSLFTGMHACTSMRNCKLNLESSFEE